MLQCNIDIAVFRLKSWFSPFFTFYLNHVQVKLLLTSIDTQKNVSKEDKISKDLEIAEEFTQTGLTKYCV